jgi:hypothetical protein
LAKGVSEVEAHTVFNNAAQKVVKYAFKHVRLISIVVYYTQVLKQQMKPTQAQSIYLTRD